MRTFFLLAAALTMGIASTPMPAAAVTPAPGPQRVVTPTCAGELVRITTEAPRFDFAATGYTISRTAPLDSCGNVAVVREAATLPSRYLRVPFRVRPEPKLVRVPLIYRGYMKRAYGRGWHPDFTYVTAPAYRAYTYISVASVPAGLLR